MKHNKDKFENQVNAADNEEVWQQEMRSQRFMSAVLEFNTEYNLAMCECYGTADPQTADDNTSHDNTTQDELDGATLGSTEEAVGGDGGGALLDDCPCDGDEGGEGTGKAGDEEGEEVKEDEKEEDLDPEELERRRQAAEEEERRRQEEELRKQEEERKRKEEEKAKKAQLDAELKEMFDGVREKKEEENERRSSGGEDEGQEEVEEEWVESKRDQTYLSKLVRKGGDGDVGTWMMPYVLCFMPFGVCSR